MEEGHGFGSRKHKEVHGKIRMEREGTTSREVIRENHPFVTLRMGNFFILVRLSKAARGCGIWPSFYKVTRVFCGTLEHRQSPDLFFSMEVLAEADFPVAPARFFPAMDAKWKRRRVAKARGRR